jgi:long-chain fatty acid transport protein
MLPMLPGGAQTTGTLSGTMVDSLGGMMQNSLITSLNWGYFDFSNDNAFYGEALGTGFSGKLGLVFKVNPQLSFGATYHAKTYMGDLTTDNGTVTMNVDGDGGALSGGDPNGTPVTGQSLPVNGKISVNDFEWPSMYGVGVAFAPVKKLTLVADVKMINWSEVMDSFKMTFTADSDQPFAGQVMDAELYQQWDDQIVYSVGAAYQVTSSLVLRAGLNRGDNPIPNQYLNALFPAVEQNHATAGAGYLINKSTMVNLSMTYAPEFKPTAGSGVSTGMSQINGQLMVSYMY